jgi:hypothetical protein
MFGCKVTLLRVSWSRGSLLPLLCCDIVCHTAYLCFGFGHSLKLHTLYVCIMASLLGVQAILLLFLRMLWVCVVSVCLQLGHWSEAYEWILSSHSFVRWHKGMHYHVPHRSDFLQEGFRTYVFSHLVPVLGRVLSLHSHKCSVIRMLFRKAVYTVLSTGDRGAIIFGFM